MSNRFLNDNTGTGGGVSTSDLNTWLATKSSDNVKQGVLNLYITPAEKTTLNSLASATTNPTPNTIAKRDGSGSSSFFNLSSVKVNTTKLVVEGSSGDIQAVVGISGSNWFFNSFNNDALYLTANSAGASNVAIGSATNQPLSFLQNNIMRAQINTDGNFFINFSGNSISPDESLDAFNIINRWRSGHNKSSGMKFWLSDTTGVLKEIGHIYVSTPSNDAITGDLVLASGTSNYSTTPVLTCKSDGRVYVNGLTSSGTLVSSSGLITTNISCGHLMAISGMTSQSNISAVKITTPDLVVNSTLLSNGTAQFVSLTSNSGRINQLTTNQLLPSTATGGLGVAELKLGEYSIAGTNDVYISTGSGGTLDIRADTILFKGAGNTPQYATYDVSSVRFFRPLITNSGIMTQTLSGGVVNCSGLLASKATILGSTGSVQSIVGIPTDTININAYTNDTLYMTTNMTTASGFSLGTGNAHRLSLLTNNTERVRITGNSGFVGIGTTTPSQKLDVNGNVNIDGNLTINSTGTQKLIGDSDDFLNLTTNVDAIRCMVNLSGGIKTAFDIGTLQVLPLRFLTNNIERARFTGLSGNFIIFDTNDVAYGNVGIGTSAPKQRLDVNGNVNCSGYVYQENRPFWNYWSNSQSPVAPAVINNFLDSSNPMNNSGSIFRNISGTPNTNGRATINVSGFYDISFDAWATEQQVAGTAQDVRIRLNGNDITKSRTYFTNSTGGYAGIVQARIITWCNKDDYIEVYVQSGRLHNEGQRFTGILI
jgi:hypothetical protein